MREDSKIKKYEEYTVGTQYKILLQFSATAISGCSEVATFKVRVKIGSFTY